MATQLNMSLDYKTPEQTYNKALNFDSENESDSNDPKNGQQQQQQQKQSINERLKNFMRRINDSAYIYPTVTILIVTLIVIITIFQQSVSLIIKVILILVFMAFLFYTIWQFRAKP
nr:GrBNV_gp51-like protein [Apis mellifera nudivirus]